MGNQIHYGGMAEKSRAATVRETQAMAKFNAVRDALEHAMIANKVRLVLLGCQPGDEAAAAYSDDDSSLFARLPTVCVHHILDYYRIAPPVPPKQEGTADGVATASAAAATAKKKKKQDEAASASTTTTTTMTTAESRRIMSIDEIMQKLYTPGNKIVLPITKPNLHLTAPCWRDFSRHVRSLDGGGGGGCWNVKRIAATPQEKIKYHEQHRKGKVYFIHAIYTVPAPGSGAAALKKKKKRASSSSKKKKAPPPSKNTSSTAHVAAAAQANSDNDNDDDEKDVDDFKPSAKKLKTTTTTTTTTTTASVTASLLQE